MSIQSLYGVKVLMSMIKLVDSETQSGVKLPWTCTVVPNLSIFNSHKDTKEKSIDPLSNIHHLGKKQARQSDR